LEKATGISFDAENRIVKVVNGTANYSYASNRALDVHCSSLPFGDGLSCTSLSGSPLHFTGKEREFESGLDNFGARYDASSMGRFMSPDWSDSPEPVPYADPDNPQSLNLYAYAGNNPLSATDEDGHDPNEPNPAGKCGWLCKFSNLFRNGNGSSTEEAGLTPLPLAGPSSIPPFRPPVAPTLRLWLSRPPYLRLWRPAASLSWMPACSSTTPTKATSSSKIIDCRKTQTCQSRLRTLIEVYSSK
jgi:RHS repeat-associated protein